MAAASACSRPSPAYTLLIEVEGVPHAVSRADEGVVRAGSPAVVVSVHVEPGDEVAAGDRLVMVEAMKMETAVTAPFAGTVRQVFVLPNSQVGPGAPLVHLDAAAEGRTRRAGPKVVFDGARSVRRPRRRPPGIAREGAAERRTRGAAGTEAAAPEPAPSVVPVMRSVVLGFDLDAAEIGRVLQEYSRLIQSLPPEDEGCCAPRTISSGSSWTCTPCSAARRPTRRRAVRR